MSGTLEVNTARRSGVVVAFDYGRRRIGVATGNLYTRTASPIATMSSSSTPPWREIAALLAEWQPERLVVGVPEGSTGEGSIADEARGFAAELGARAQLPVDTVDETLTSAAAESALRDARRQGARRIRKTRIDQHAACLIAEQWMSERTDDPN